MVENTTPVGSEQRFPCLDGMRALAVTLVILFHFAFESAWLRHEAGRYIVHFNIGVEIFFVLSGFLIYRPFVVANVRGTRVRPVRDYASRRILRIYPAYLLAFVVLLAAGEIHVSGGAGIAKHASLTYLYFHDPSGVGIAQSWTIVVELSFYVLAPLWGVLMRTVSRRVSPFATELAGCSFLIVIGFGASWLQFFKPPAAPLVVLPPALPAFGGGMLLATLSASASGDPALARTLHRLAQHASAWWLAAAALYVYLAWLPYNFLGSTPRELMWDHSLKVPISVLLVMPAVFGDQGRGVIRGLLRWRPVAYVGLVSYGVYLWHARIFPHIATNDALNHSGHAVALLALAGGYAATVAIATASYYLLERPALRLAAHPGVGRPRQARSAVRPADGPTPADARELAPVAGAHPDTADGAAFPERDQR